MAVKNGDFELADLLLKYGANVNFTYQPADGGYLMTVLCELLQEHSEKNLRAIQYLFEAGRVDGGDPHIPTKADITAETIPKLNTVFVPPPKPDLVCVKPNIRSALHMLACCPPENWNTRNQISSRITHIVLSAFNRPEEVNYQTSGLGTALSVACFLGNLDMVTALLAFKADTSIIWDLAKYYDLISLAPFALHFNQPVGSPLFMAKYRLCELEQRDPQNDKIARLKSIIELLTDGEAEPGIGVMENIGDLRLQESKTPDLDSGRRNFTLSSPCSTTPQLTSIAAAKASSHGDEPARSAPASSTLQDPEINEDHDHTHTAADLNGASTDHASVPNAKVASLKEGGLAP